MSRTAKKRRTPDVKPVTKVELTDKNIALRLAGIVVLILIAATALIYSISSLLSVNSGWVTIETESSAEVNCSSDFVFQYCIGESGIAASAEKKTLITLYTDATVNAYQLFNNDETFDNVVNIAYINAHPNETIEVDALLYEAFEKLENYSDRNIYLAPVYAEYSGIFSSQIDSETYDYDVFQNAEVSAYFAELLPYVEDENAVSIELLGDNEIILHVSDEYLSYANENGMESFIDFSWMKNAFIVDYIADTIADQGYTFGSISSYDGFVRNLDDKSETSYSYNLYDREDQTVYPAGIMQYTGARSIVYLRDYRMTELDDTYYYEFENGEIRTSYIDLVDGKCKASTDSLVSYSSENSCADILLQLIPVYISDTFDESSLWELENQNIYSIYYSDSTIYYNDESLTLSDLYDKEGLTYTTEYVN